MPQASAMVDAMPISSKDPFMGLPHRCRVPKIWAVLHCFSRVSSRDLDGKGAARIRTGAHMGSRACKVRTLTTSPSRLALFIYLYFKVRYTERRRSARVAAVESEARIQDLFWVSYTCEGGKVLGRPQLLS